MFNISSAPPIISQTARLIIGGHGKTYYINKDEIPYLEIEIAPNLWNPFNSECFFNDYFCIGNGRTAYFVNLHTQKIKSLSCDMYFGYFYINKDKLYVASNSSLSCLNPDCELLWVSEKIAVDGLIVDEFLSDRVVVSCEIDPPDHWEQHQLLIHSGERIS